MNVIINGVAKVRAGWFGARPETRRGSRALRPGIDGLERRECLTVAQANAILIGMDQLVVKTDAQVLSGDVAAAEKQHATAAAKSINLDLTQLNTDAKNNNTAAIIQDVENLTSLALGEELGALLTHAPASTALLSNSQVDTDLAKTLTDIAGEEKAANLPTAAPTTNIASFFSNLTPQKAASGSSSTPIYGGPTTASNNELTAQNTENLEFQMAVGGI